MSTLKTLLQQSLMPGLPFDRNIQQHFLSMPELYRWTSKESSDQQLSMQKFTLLLQRSQLHSLLLPQLFRL